MARSSFLARVLRSPLNDETVISLYLKNLAREQTLHFARDFLLRDRAERPFSPCKGPPSADH